MSRPTAQTRRDMAQDQIDRLTYDINYHDYQASKLRKEREKFKAKLQRAKDAIARQDAAAAWSKYNAKFPN